ncbi:MAG: hypothetical protein B7Y50_09135 [Hydrogenophilales bacterium 28-61-11]|nr:MAG: hypothetical protein B7Y50_09135 [Hydrogenophilales bacterium 28-61-11]OYZ56122.1 MAG: hypothetical protein B7Y21_12735 [Hydrogenophilales bacterium 16-61-112]
MAAAPVCALWSELAVAVWAASPELLNPSVLFVVGLAQVWALTPSAIAMAVDMRVLFIVPLLESVLDDEKKDCQEWTKPLMPAICNCRASNTRH